MIFWIENGNYIHKNCDTVVNSNL